MTPFSPEDLNCLRTIGDPIWEKYLAAEFEANLHRRRSRHLWDRVMPGDHRRERPSLSDFGRQRVRPEANTLAGTGWYQHYLEIVHRDGLTGPELLRDRGKDQGPKDQDQEAILWVWDRLLEFGQTLDPKPPFEELDLARSLFVQYGSEICAALLLAGLPEAYASSWGARVLACSGELSSNLRRRIRGTAQFLVQVLAPETSVQLAWNTEDGAAFRDAMALRLFHHVIRSYLLAGATNGDRSEDSTWDALGPMNRDDERVPLNQEDLLATRLTFSVTVFEVLERFGVSWSSDEQAAYLKSWNFIGSVMGIGGPQIEAWPVQKRERLTPASVRDARTLLEQLRGRQWIEVKAFRAEPPSPEAADGIDHATSNKDSEPFGVMPNGDVSLLNEWDSLRPGRILVRALLDELVQAMPNWAKGWPLVVMRELVDDVVRIRLGLGSSGFAMTGLEKLPQRKVQVARFTSLTVENRARGWVLRVMANEVARHATIFFLQSSDPPPFVLPGLEQWSSGIGTRYRRRAVYH